MQEKNSWALKTLNYLGGMSAGRNVTWLARRAFFATTLKSLGALQ
jgi:hypothetical protein